jgi:hypothetical protein
MPARRRRSRKARGAVAVAIGVVAGIVLFGIGASVLWSSLIGLGTFGMSFGASFLVGGGAEGTDLDEGTGVAGLSGGDDVGDV